MFGDEGRSIRHRVEERPEGSIAASVVVRIEDTGVDVHRNNLKTRRKRGVYARAWVDETKLRRNSSRALAI